MEFRLLTDKHLAMYQFRITGLWIHIAKAKIRTKLHVYHQMSWNQLNHFLFIHTVDAIEFA